MSLKEARGMYYDFLDSYGLGKRATARGKLHGSESPQYVPARNGFNGSKSSVPPKSGEYIIKTNDGKEVRLTLSNESLSKLTSSAKIDEFRRATAK
jgi:hypothetical protein